MHKCYHRINPIQLLVCYHSPKTSHSIGTPPPTLPSMSLAQQKSVAKPMNGRGTTYPEILPRGYIPTNPVMEKDTPRVAFNRRCLKEQHIPIRWICIKCDYKNYNETPICGMCKRPKSECVRIESSVTSGRESRIDGKPQFDEWKCPQCSQFNYLFRDVCRSCHFHISRAVECTQPKIRSHSNRMKRFL